MTERLVATPAIKDAEVSVEQIAIAELRPSPLNPRKNIDAAILAQLASSIEQLGVQVPLLVRHDLHGEKPGFGYEIVSGHRRFFAAQHTKLKSLPCIVREMSDDEAREIMLVENLQREDLPALEEAEAYADLLATLGSAPAVAARVGKPVEYVTRRLKLRTLIDYSRRALGEKLITIDHALLLAKLADKEQEIALRYALDRQATQKQKTEALLAAAVKGARDGNRNQHFGHYWEAASVFKLKDFIEQNIKLELKRAPWDLADAKLLPSAGPCAGCAKNTADNPALFGDLAVKDARCTDAVCFNAKRDAFVQLQLAAVQSAGNGAVRISWKYTEAKPRSIDDEKKYLAQVFKAGQWIEAKKGSCGLLHTGVTVDFEESEWVGADAKKKPGRKLLVCVAVTCKVHPKGWQKAATANRNGGGGYDAKAEEEKRKRGEFLAEQERPIRAKVWSAVLGGLNAASAIRLAADNQQDARQLRKDIFKQFPGIDGELLSALTVFAGKFRHQSLHTSGYLMREPRGVADGRHLLWALAQAVGLDANAIAAKHFHDEGSIAPGAELLYPKGVPWPKNFKRPSPAEPKALAKKSEPAPKAKSTAAKKKKAVRK
ncbi:MAG TPA: ParB/RepB/Spo0J family partition protein [Silvibacterium sp.]|nr:ParB/RepB/Spo0J family partition protein [Silvibacterium sp.]